MENSVKLLEEQIEWLQSGGAVHCLINLLALFCDQIAPILYYKDVEIYWMDLISPCCNSGTAHVAFCANRTCFHWKLCYYQRVLMNADRISMHRLHFFLYFVPHRRPPKILLNYHLSLSCAITAYKRNCIFQIISYLHFLFINFFVVN